MGKIELKKAREEKEFSVFTERIVEKDEKTGEILKDMSVDVIKAKKRDNFIKIFVTNLDFLGANLTNAERQVLVGLLGKVDFQNIVYIHSELRKDLEKKYEISQATITAGIKGLKEKKVLLELTSSLQEKFEIYANNAYLINPDIAGKGSFNELKKLRQEISIEYNFDNLEIKRSFYTKSEYEGFSEIQNSPENHEVKQIMSEVSSDKKKVATKILVAQKNNDDVIDVEAGVAESKKSDIEIENENLRLKIKALELEKVNKELEKVNKELENAKLDKEIELTKLQRGAQPSLNFGDDNK